jgi:TonB family protein
VEINPYTHQLRISVRIGAHDHLNENAELNEKVNELAKRLKPTEFSLSKTALFAVVEVPADKLDKTVLIQGIQKAASEGDRAYPEVARFIKLDAPASTGPGYGTGVGTGGGVGPGPAYESKTTSPSTASKPVEVDSKPVPLNRVRPGYTPEARKNNIQGSVLLRLVVDENGDAKQIRVVRALPDGLTEKAIEAAYKTKFKPAMKDGKPVSYSIALEINFNLY